MPRAISSLFLHEVIQGSKRANFTGWYIHHSLLWILLSSGRAFPSP